ncbi:uncharacterized protein LOC5502169 isoform X2 [Nematostella vectensis]|nr:uncharacterized protein LOC5502169 isoform X2 [Nematostella vectensis]
MEDNIVRHFVGNTGSRHMVVTRTLNSSVRAQYVRFYPKKAYGHPCIRVEVYGCPVSEALGVEDGRIPDLNMSSSSARGPGFEAYRGRLNNLHGNGSWCSNMSLPKNQQYLRIDLGNVWEVTAVETQGNPFLYCEMVMKTVNCSDFNSSALPGELCEVPAQYCRGSWVKMFSLDYSLDGKEWRKYGEEGITKEFTANENPNSTVRNYLKGVTARLISIQPKDFKFRMCLRIEIHGREACTGDLGISNGRIPDGQLSSSSTAGLNYAAKYARLMNPTRVWCASPDDPTPYLQIDLYSTHRVRFIETRGHVVNGSGLWVASYYLQFSVDGEEWYNYTRGGTVQIFAGNTNGNNIAKRDLPGPIVAVYIRIKPVTWVGYTACLRIDFKGCKVCSDALGLESGEIENDAIQSNLYDQFAEPYNARLRMNKRGWLTTEHLLNVKLFIIVDFGPGLAVVNGIATQGYGSYHVARYTLSYSEDMVLWRDHTENGMKRIFKGTTRKEIVRHNFRKNVTTRYVELTVVTVLFDYPSLRMELYGCRVCERALGMAGKSIPDSSITASSTATGYNEFDARLHGPSAWCAASNNLNKEYLQVDLLTVMAVTGFAMQGLGIDGPQVTYYQVSTALSILRWEFIVESIGRQRFDGPSSSDAAHIDRPRRPRTARYVRFWPIKFSSQMCARVEIYGREASPCENPSDGGATAQIGMTSGYINSSRITASSSLGADYQPYYGRLSTNLGKGAWCALDQDDRQYLQVDLEVPYRIMGFSTQGKHRMSDDTIGHAWVTLYNVSVSSQGYDWSLIHDESNVTLVFAGNSISNLTVKHLLASPVVGRLVRFLPTAWYNRICMRVEVFGCKVCDEPLGMENLKILDSAIKSHSWDGPYYYNFYARLHIKQRSWRAALVVNQFLQVDLGPQTKRVTGIATSGRRNAWVRLYTLSYSLKEAYWVDYYENGKPKVFKANTECLSIVKNIIRSPFKAKYIKMDIKGVMNYIDLQIEMYGCTVCLDALGLDDAKKYPDSIFAASSSESTDGYHPYMARLGAHAHEKSWCASTKSENQWLSVTLSKAYPINGLAVKGNEILDQWTQTIKIEYTDDLIHWYSLRENDQPIFPANQNSTEIISINFKETFLAQKLKIYTYQWKDLGCLKIELFFGCDDCMDEIPLYEYGPRTTEMTASSYFGPGFEPYLGSSRHASELHGWCAGSDVGQQFLQYSFKVANKITGITTEGLITSPHDGNASWVSRFRVEYSLDGRTWSNYTERGQVKIFHSGRFSTFSSLRDTTARNVKIVPITWTGWICMKAVLHGCAECSSPLGLESHKSTMGLRSSTSHGHQEANEGRLHNVDRGFSARDPGWDMPVFLEVEIRNARQRTVTAVAVQPNYQSDKWTYCYYITYSPRGIEFYDYTEGGRTRIFRGYRDRETAVKSALSQPIVLRFLRFYPTRWYEYPGLRVELYGCETCESPLGMQSGAIPNSSITASAFKAGHEPWKGRLGSATMWCAGNPIVSGYTNFFQVDLQQLTEVTSVEIFGDATTNNGVKTVSFAYSRDGIWWNYYYESKTSVKIFEPAWDAALPGRAELRSEFYTRFLRIIPVVWQSDPCMSVEIRGCQVVDPCEHPVGIATAQINNSSMSASSWLGPGFKPWLGRLNSGGAWCSRHNNVTQYLQVILQPMYSISAVVIQGKEEDVESGEAWVTKFKVEYSDAKGVWNIHEENGSSVFNGCSDGNTPSVTAFSRPLFAKTLRVRPVQWQNHICIRMELRGCQVKGRAVGMESGELEATQITASSSRFPQLARLHGNSGWGYNSPNDEFLQVSIYPHGKLLSGIAVQGATSYTTRFTLHFSMDAKQWFDYTEEGEIKYFEGNKDTYSVRLHYLSSNLTAGHIRITPKQWYIGPFLKIELFGFDGCDFPIGVANFPSSLFSASSFELGQEPWKAKLGAESWCANGTGDKEYLQIDLADIYVVSGFASEGHPSGMYWMSSFYVEYKEKEHEEWAKFGTTNAQYVLKISVKAADPNVPRIKTQLYQKLQARYLKLVNQFFVGKPCLRIEVYGCLARSFEVGLSNYMIQDELMTASSYMDPYTRPEMARLHTARGHGAWCANMSDIRPYLQIDLRSQYDIGFIAIQGQRNKEAWVEQFKISYRQLDQDWINYNKVFQGSNDDSSVIKYTLNTSINARFIRIYPVKWKQRACLRMELYGFHVGRKDRRSRALGMQNGDIPSSNISALTWSENPPWNGRLMMSNYWYAPRSPNFLLVDLGLYGAVITAVASQGYESRAVRGYSLHFSTDGVMWVHYTQFGQKKIFTGNLMNAWHVVVNHTLDKHPPPTRYVKIFVESVYSSFFPPGMKVELYGYYVCNSSILFPSENSSYTEPGVNYTMSHTYGMLTHNASLTGHITWCAEFNDSRQFLQLELSREVLVKGIDIQDHGTQSLLYNLLYANENQGFTAYRSRGELSPRTFTTGRHDLFEHFSARFIKIIPFFKDSLCMELHNIIGCDHTHELGMGNQKIEDDEISASSVLAGQFFQEEEEKLFSAFNTRLDSDTLYRAWCAGAQDTQQYLQIDLKYTHHVVAIVTQGQHRTGHESWVTEYSVSYSQKSESWEWYSDNEDIKVLTGNQNPHHVMRQELHPPITARHVRIHPHSWNGSICMRVELIGNSVCFSPLGINYGLIPNSAMKSMNATLDLENESPWHGRLLSFKQQDRYQGAWCVSGSDTERKLQIDLGEEMVIAGVATQGRFFHYTQTVSSYALLYSSDGLSWTNFTENGKAKVFPGNHEKPEEVAYHILSNNFTARYVRFHVLTWVERPCMRVELLGCHVPTPPAQNGGYTNFTAWSECPVTCGGGIQTKTRNCTNPEPNFNGTDCDVLGPRVRTRPCNIHLCPAPNITFPLYTRTDESFTVEQPSCDDSKFSTYSIGNTSTNTTVCSVSHAFSLPGIYPVRVSREKHLPNIGIIYTQNAISGLAFVNISSSILVGKTFTFFWTFDVGTMVIAYVNYGDETIGCNVTVGESERPHVSTCSHIFTTPGIYIVTLLTSNFVSNQTIFAPVIVEHPVNILNISLRNLGKFDRIYQLDNLEILLEVNGSNPHVNYTMDNGVLYTEIVVFSLVHNYPLPGVYNVTVHLFNNVSQANASLVIEVYEIIPFTKTNLTVRPQSFLGASLMHFDVNGSNPYECIWSFGDGNSSLVSSLENKAVITYLYNNVGVYDVTVNCSNNLGYIVSNGVAIVQNQIEEPQLTSDSPREINETMTFTITASEFGTNSCYVADIGNDTVIGYGKSHCLARFSNVTFKDEAGPLTFGHIYQEVKVYYTKLTAWNLVSEFTIYGHVVALKIPCNNPNTSIINLGLDKENATALTRPIAKTFLTATVIDCKATQLKDNVWTIQALTPIGEPQTVGTFEDYTLEPKTLHYGQYRVRFNVSMRGQEGVYQHADAYFQIKPSSLVATIRGGQVITRKFGSVVTFDASNSYDPDYDGTSDFNYYWFCYNKNSTIKADIEVLSAGQPLEYSPEFSHERFCNSSYPNRLMKAGDNVSLDLGRLLVNESYAIVLVVARTLREVKRRTMTTQTLHVVPGNPPALEISCLRNCRAKAFSSEKFSFVGSCENETITNPVSYSWQLFEETADGRSLLVSANHMDNITTTGTLQKFIVMRANSLKGGVKYRLILTGRMYGRTDGRSEYVFIVNLPPQFGSCFIDKPTGLANITEFTLSCSDWQDTDTPLNYEFNYINMFGLATTLYYGERNTVVTKLPVGNPGKNFTLEAVVKIADCFGSYTTQVMATQVLIPPGEENALTDEVYQLIADQDGMINKLMIDGKTQELTQEINCQMSIINILATHSGRSGSEEDRSTRQKTRSMVVDLFENKTVTSLSAVKQIGSTIAMVSAIKEEVDATTQRKVLKSLTSMKKLMTSKINNTEVSSKTLEEVGVVLVFGIGNLIAAAGDSARNYGDPPAKEADQPVNASRSLARQLSLEATKSLDEVSKNLLSLQVPGEEAIQIVTPFVGVVLKKVFPDKVGEAPISCNGAVVNLPPASTMFDNKTLGSRHIDTQTIKFEDNPNTWDETSESIKSSVVSMELRNDNNFVLTVANLSTPINLFIPRASPESDRNETLFVPKRNGSIVYHSYNITLDELPVGFRVGGDPRSSFHIFLKMNDRPQVHTDEVIAILPNYSMCNESNPSYDEETCEADAYTIFLDDNLITKPGLYYIGLRHFMAEEKISKRVRRDCGGSSRERRSCLLYKDPPPRPTQAPGQGGRLETVVPVFDEKRDVRYTIDKFQSSCKYWDVEREVWTTKGCKVGNLTKLNKVHCICDHLTAFGGGLLVAPNPIDFDKVWAGFKNISDNLSVVVTIATGFGLYLLIAFWARRKDKKDYEKNGITVIETDANFGEHLYELSIYTGSWKGSSTTAKVFIDIFGEQGQSGPIALKDEDKQLFTVGAVNTFLVPLDYSLGPLLYLRVWHDLSGYDSSWYLNFIIVRDLQANVKWVFVCDRWLALEKDDGLADRVLLVSTDKDLKTFKTLFNTKISNDLFDGHLWMSIVKKPPKSSFTRVQRLTCCMSLLYTTMMTSAMFYNVGGKQDNSTLTLGPITLSIRQIMIGVQSSLIALPGNLIILQIFRNITPRGEEKKQTKRQKAYEVEDTSDESECYSKTAEEKGENAVDKENKGVEKKKKLCPEQIPYWFLYVAWALAISMILVSATITLFYSMMWGKEISNQWLSSMLVSFFQDAFVTQPIKVCALAVFVAAVLKTLPQEFSDAKKDEPELTNSRCNSNLQSQKEESKSKMPFYAPDPEMVERARKFKLKETQMFGIMSSVTFHLVFLALLAVVGYTSRDPMSYQQMVVIEDSIGHQVGNIRDFWAYVDNTFLPFAFNERGYNGIRMHQEGVSADANLFIIGMPRFRQLRVQEEPCKTNHSEMCHDKYSAFNEEKSYFLPGWRTRANLTFTECPVPWRHKDFIELNTVPYWGNLGWYGGGGYTADLGYNIIQAQGIIKDLVRNNWLDQQTRATFIEFTVFNAQVNLFSVTTYLLESIGTGGGFSLLKIDTFRLHPHVGPGQALVILCELAVVVVTIILAYSNIKKIYQTRMEFFKITWNIVQLVVIGLTLSAVVLFVIRLIDTQRTIQKLQENPFVFVSFHYATKWAELNTYIVAIVIFLSTLRLLYLMSFNRHIIVLYHSVSKSLKSLGFLAVESVILYGAFAIFAYVVFGPRLDGFGTFMQTCQALFAMMLGKGYYTELSRVDPILGPLFFSFFTVSMMFFMLNMFVAVLMEPYEEAKQEFTGDGAEFEMATFMLDRFKVFIGVGKPPGDPWRDSNQPRPQYLSFTKQLKRELQILEECAENAEETVNRLTKVTDDIHFESLEFILFHSS